MRKSPAFVFRHLSRGEIVPIVALAVDAAARLRAFAYRRSFRAIGHDSRIGRPVMISGSEFISIGSQTLIRAGCRLEAIALPARPSPDLRIGSRVNIEQFVHIVCHNRITIGDDVSITGGCAIVDVTHPLDAVGKVGAQIADDDRFVEIGAGAFLGYGTVVLPGVRIGEGAVIGANSVVSSDIPAHSVAAGVPARVLGNRDPNRSTDSGRVRGA